MRFPRSSGVLLHPTSLPGNYGIGELGAEAFAFVDWLASAGQSLWQVLPLGPTGYGDSPYQSFSSFAGNPLLISLDALVADGYLSRDDVAAAPNFPSGNVDYGRVITWKNKLLRRAAPSFKHSQRAGHRVEFQRFANANASWLDDYALFAALKHHFSGAMWSAWPEPIRKRDMKAVATLHETRLQDDVLHVKFLQWQFFRQWHMLKQHAHALGIRIVGDIPIFVAYDSADVWAHPELFYLDADGKPTVVAGVPPDYFSQTGQLWGNPLYRWDVLAQHDYDWWIERVRFALQTVDVVRMDHFRGFEAYWEIPATETTAIHGRWVPGPGRAPFDAIVETFHGTSLPIIAEDLGVITPEVVALRERFGFPGMKILQFAFGLGADNPLPHSFERHCVAYTGTHDNDTAIGWFKSANNDARAHALAYMGTDGSDFAWDLIRLGAMSVADTFIAPMQDLLSLGSEARMNFPSKPSGNWQWRMSADALTPRLAERLKKVTVAYGRDSEKRIEQKNIGKKEGITFDMVEPFASSVPPRNASD